MASTEEKIKTVMKEIEIHERCAYSDDVAFLLVCPPEDFSECDDEAVMLVKKIQQEEKSHIRFGPAWVCEVLSRQLDGLYEELEKLKGELLKEKVEAQDVIISDLRKEVADLKSRLASIHELTV
jgi:hypothetical protein